jgi:hypothetical protein
MPKDTSVFFTGIIPWVNLDNPGKELNRLVDSDEVVLAFAIVTLIIDYRLPNLHLLYWNQNQRAFPVKN